MDLLFPSLVNSFVQAISYGLYIATFSHCLRWLLYDNESWKGRNKLNWPMLTISILVFLLGTAGLGTSFRMTLALHQSDDLLYNTFNTVNSALEYTTFQIVDAVLIYRCWVVYNYSWRVICLPGLFWIAGVILSSYDIYLYSVALNTYDPEAIDKLALLTLHIWNGFFACNIAVNIYATCTIIYRILRVMRISTANTSGWRLSQTCRIVAESGALYTFSTIVNLIATVLLAQDDRFNYFQSAADPLNFSMAGIAFNLILIRVGQQRAARNPVPDSAPSSDANISAIRFRHESTKATESQNPSTLHSKAEC
ncbi:hypothetical protein M378DRAFT_168815 [Amanita muscaria Koide BX008]|uniref:Uncharacterized protein n=1 Tax=Amanita muscaria (strain Koide BX008) TaxID=946122 RepID=A0A0C2WEJ3_AMAMK|nr:hypothetical protein M378DRAFT_168815 [Amanita muscaria Koide BX008]